MVASVAKWYSLLRQAKMTSREVVRHGIPYVFFRLEVKFRRRHRAGRRRHSGRRTPRRARVLRCTPKSLHLQLVLRSTLLPSSKFVLVVLLVQLELMLKFEH